VGDVGAQNPNDLVSLDCDGRQHTSRAGRRHYYACSFKRFAVACCFIHIVFCVTTDSGLQHLFIIMIIIIRLAVIRLFGYCLF
jgi:hypothetical protein